MDKLVVIDGNSLINRAYYALPLLTNACGEYSNAIYGFCNLLTKVILNEKPKYIAICFDAGKHTFRNDIYADYKGTRKPMPLELAEQLPNLKEILKDMGIYIVEQIGVEADDLIGSISKKFNLPTVILSGDRDLLQLIDDTTEVHLTKKGVTDIDVMTVKSLMEKMEIKPYQVVELKALMGDSSDNIPGVLGIGEKTAKELVKKYDNIDNLYAHIDELKGAQKEKIINGKQSAYMSKVLATINTNVPLDITLDDLTYEFPYNHKVYKQFVHYEFKSLLARSNIFATNSMQNENTKVNKIYIDNISQLNSILLENKGKNFSIFINNNIHFAFDEQTEYVVKLEQESSLLGLSLAQVLWQLKPLLEDENIKKTCLDIKMLKHTLMPYNIKLLGADFDVSLAGYLTSGNKKGLDKIEFYLSRYEFDKEDICCCLNYSRKVLFDELKKEQLDNLYYTLEFPLIDVLFQMEVDGFKLNRELLKEFIVEYKAEIDKILDEIKALGGGDININSPKQLGEFLFDKLLLPKPKKNAGTGVEILNKLVGAHPIIEKILIYRKLIKLYNTYLLDFEKMMDKDDLIHTVFNQTLTATGRLSSAEPNLQNIPIKTEEGKMLRKLFIPRHENGFIISADYSQIELRILAHYSKEPKLLYAYNHGLDIHAQTASEIFGTNFNAVSYEQRRKAKAVNFGIIYGISEFGLADDLNISIKEAKDYINKYFETYPAVKTYMTSCVEQAKQTGYAVSLLGRKRKIDELNSPNYMVRQFGERASKNMPLQGSASDIIKMAMIKVSEAIKANNLKSKLILQIHDELIIDTVFEEKEIVEKILKDCMENVAKLNVPLVVDISCGKTWFEAK